MERGRRLAKAVPANPRCLASAPQAVAIVRRARQRCIPAATISTVPAFPIHWTPHVSIVPNATRRKVVVSTAAPTRPEAAVAKTGRRCINVHITWSASSDARNAIPDAKATSGETSAETPAPMTIAPMVSARPHADCTQSRRQSVAPMIGRVVCRRPRDACHWRDKGMTNAWVARFGRRAVSSPDEPGPAFSGKSAASGRPCATRFPE